MGGRCGRESATVFGLSSSLRGLRNNRALRKGCAKLNSTELECSSAFRDGCSRPHLAPPKWWAATTPNPRKRFFRRNRPLSLPSADGLDALTDLITKVPFRPPRIAYTGPKIRGGVQCLPAQKTARPNSHLARSKSQHARRKNQVARRQSQGARTRNDQNAPLFSGPPETQPGACNGHF